MDNTPNPNGNRYTRLRKLAKNKLGGVGYTKTPKALLKSKRRAKSVLEKSSRRAHRV